MNLIRVCIWLTNNGYSYSAGVGQLKNICSGIVQPDCHETNYQLYCDELQHTGNNALQT